MAPSLPGIVVYCTHLTIENPVIDRAMRDAVIDLENVDFRDL